MSLLNYDTKKENIRQEDIRLESIRLEQNFAEIRNAILWAVQNNTPFLPVRDWLDKVKTPMLVPAYTSTHIQLIEDRSAEVKQLVNMFGYAYSDINGFAIATNGGKKHTPAVKELALIKAWEILYNLDETTLIENVVCDYEAIMQTYEEDIDTLTNTIYQKMKQFVRE